jgi:hypothetical protein
MVTTIVTELYTLQGLVHEYSSSLLNISYVENKNVSPNETYFYVRLMQNFLNFMSCFEKLEKV